MSEKERQDPAPAAKRQLPAPPKEGEPTAPPAESLKCGVVMPISALETCSEQHWLDVRGILYDAIRDAGFEPNLVSNSDDVGIIQKRIIQNLYENPIVVCDVSGKNPNVMFELGLRLAFDKPTIIVKDDQTTYSFDTSPIEHLEYPRDLRFNRIVVFKESLREKIRATHRKATEDKDYTTFLKNFGQFAVAKLDTTVLPKDDFILAQLTELRRQVENFVVAVRSPQVGSVLQFEMPSSSCPLSSRNCERRLHEAVSAFMLKRHSLGNEPKDLNGLCSAFLRDMGLSVLPDLPCFDDADDQCKAILTRVAQRVLGKKLLPSKESKSRDQ